MNSFIEEMEFLLREKVKRTLKQQSAEVSTQTLNDLVDFELQLMAQKIYKLCNETED